MYWLQLSVGSMTPALRTRFGGHFYDFLNPNGRNISQISKYFCHIHKGNMYCFTFLKDAELHSWWWDVDLFLKYVLCLSCFIFMFSHIKMYIFPGILYICFPFSLFSLLLPSNLYWCGSYSVLIIYNNMLTVGCLVFEFNNFICVFHFTFVFLLMTLIPSLVP